ncbi:MAG: DNA-binding transcriptional regulator [Burkholderiales bacterium]|nr:DNA-binding transcriptional regulator [Phycisphaerae bacterium]
MKNPTGSNNSGSARRTPRPKRRVLLAMGFSSYQRQAGIVRYAREAGWVVDSRLLSFHAIDRDREYLNASQFDGVITLMSRAAPWMPDLIKTFSVPVVDMWIDYLDEKYPRVLLDQAAIGRTGAEHLLARGFQNLLFFTHTIEGGARRAGFREVVIAAGRNYLELTWDHNARPEGAETRLTWLASSLAKSPLPLAVMGANDHIAAEVLEAAEFAGLKVPRDVAVLGVDNDPLVTELALVPLSSVDTCREQVGYETAALLDRMMNGEPAPLQPIYIAPKMVVTRRSTDVLAARDHDVAAAVQFIQEHFREPLAVDDVADNSAVSRRYLQDRFRADTGRTISDAITWQRLDHAQKLLVETRSKIQMIAQQSGFGSGERLSKVFRRHLGMTPQEFRDRYTKGR